MVFVVVVVGETSCATPQVNFLPFLTQVYFNSLTVFVAPAGEQLEPGLSETDADVEPAASARTKMVEAEIEKSLFKN